MKCKWDILTTLGNGIYKDDTYTEADMQAISMIKEYYRRFIETREIEERMNITILSRDNLNFDSEEAEEQFRWNRLKDAIGSEIVDANFVDITLINCIHEQEIESAFIDHIDFTLKTYKNALKPLKTKSSR